MCNYRCKKRRKYQNKKMGINGLSDFIKKKHPDRVRFSADKEGNDDDDDDHVIGVSGVPGDLEVPGEMTSSSEEDNGLLSSFVLYVYILDGNTCGLSSLSLLL